MAATGRLNRALHMILVTRRRTHAPTIAYIERRIHEGKSRREAIRCLKRYLARNLYRLLEHHPTRSLIEASPRSGPALASLVRRRPVAVSLLFRPSDGPSLTGP